MKILILFLFTSCGLTVTTMNGKCRRIHGRQDITCYYSESDLECRYDKTYNLKRCWNRHDHKQKRISP